MNSIARYGYAPEVSTSRIFTVLFPDTRLIATASFLNFSLTPGTSANSGRSTFSATSFPFESRAAKTIPLAPDPSLARIWYWPIDLGSDF